ncbi:Aromatic-amino-acid aminotransferase 1 (ARAT-I) (AROAT) [Durusdinium trenchii]|uniref:Aromatic-amino-acid aminotransferase 1 (ARAT-I) (AROAT) n=1 Tax=Durusdinium trenchii TaxID=1381693 RepID=A0ABP0SSF6_9DINO
MDPLEHVLNTFWAVWCSLACSSVYGCHVWHVIQPQDNQQLQVRLDFSRGWPHPELLQGSLPAQLAESFQRGLAFSSESLNYGDQRGSFRFGHPKFLESLSGFLSKQYEAQVEPSTLMTTGGASMGIDLAMRSLSSPGDVCVFEEPTYYLSFDMARNHGLVPRGVPIYQDGMDLDRLEEICISDKVRIVYTIPVHHNPTGYTMANNKRMKLLELARKYDFLVVADEAYQLLNFEKPMAVKPLFYHDRPEEPRVVSVGTFSKLIGPGVKVGWAQAYPTLLQALTRVGYVASGGNPVTFSSMALLHFVESQLAEHIEDISKELKERCQIMCESLAEVGLEAYRPKGGYFVWVKADGLVTSIGKAGSDFAICKKKFPEYTRLCFSWLSKEEIRRGILALRG